MRSRGGGGWTANGEPGEGMTMGIELGTWDAIDVEGVGSVQEPLRNSAINLGSQRQPASATQRNATQRSKGGGGMDGDGTNNNSQSPCNT